MDAEARRVIRIPVQLAHGLTAYFEVFEPEWEPFDFKAWWDGLSAEEKHKIAMQYITAKYQTSSGGIF